MRARLALPLLLLSLLAPGSAAAETCLSNASFAWSSVASGAWTGCTPSADDQFRIRAGHVVDVVGDIRQSATHAAGIVVESGGTLRARVADDAIVLSLGSSGLSCVAGSTCELRGGYRAFGGAHPTTQPEQSDAAYLYVGDVLPCPGIDASGAVEPDCGGALATPGDPTVVRSSIASPPARIQDGLSRVESDDGTGAGEDVLCFFDPDPGDALAPPDVNYCYRVTGTGAGDPAWIDFDVRQTGWTERDSDYPIARRLPVQLPLAAAVAAGDREILVDGSLLAAGQDGFYEGYWIHFQADAEPCDDGDTVPCRVAPRGFRIVDTKDGGAGQPDRIRVGDLAGVDAGAAAGETAWILVGGWATGDPISVWAPVVVRSASLASEDAPLIFEGATSLRSVWFDDAGTVNLRGGVFSMLEARDLWLANLSSPSTTSGSFQIDATVNLFLRVEHLTISGGNRFGAGSDRLHGFVHPTGFGSQIELRDVAIRHNGDDCVVSGVDDVAWDIERLRCQYRSDDAVSTSALDTSGAPLGSAAVRDLECVRCTEVGGDAINSVPSVPMTVDGILVWGNHSRVGAWGAAMTDVIALGSEPGPTSAFVYGNLERFVFREITLGGTASVANEPNVSLRDGILRDVAVAGTVAFPFRGDAEMDNVALVDLTNTASCGGACIAIRLAADPVTILSRITTAWTPLLDLDLPGESIPDRVLHSNATSHAGVILDGLLVTGHQKPTAISLSMPAAAAQQTAWGDGPCFHDNRANFTSAMSPYMPPTMIQGQAPGYFDLAAGRVDTLPGSVADVAGCGIARGAGAPGVRHRWIHAISALAPERMADDADADGVPEDPEAPVCANGVLDGCDDNCPGVFDPSQADADGDGVGDACDVACDDGVDDDGDGFADFPDDPGCASAADASESGSAFACDDGVDDDGDGLVDADDPGCPSPVADDESPRCDDGVDNDGDGFIDFADPQCSALNPYREGSGSSCGLGGEALLLLAALWRARRSARRG